MEAKKISFGFSKISKKPLQGGSSAIAVNAKQRNDGDKIELISCLEGQSIKIVGKENGDDEPPPLVIPLRDQDKTTIPDRLAKLQDIIEGRDSEEVNSKKEEKISDRPIDGETLEQRAAREILDDLKERKSPGNGKNSMVVPLKPEDLPLDGGREPTLNDYESIPIENFGLAMLRGMGWKEDPNTPKKDSKFPDVPVQRPKGMGLGAERMPKGNNQQLIPPAKDEVLAMKKGAFVKVLAGKHKESYGTVESLDEENARVVVRFSISGNHESLNEYLLQLVSNAEYKKYSKVLNNAKYEEFKNRTTVAVKEETPDDRKIIKREPSDEPSASSSSKSQSFRSNRDYDPSRDRRDRSPERHNRRDRQDRQEEDRRHHRTRDRCSPSREVNRRYDRRRSATSSSDDDSSSDKSDEGDRNRHQSRYRHKTSSSYARTSSGTKKKSHKYKQRRDHSRERAHSSDEDDRHHKKKTKKSKKQRSRSRSRR